MREFKMIVSSGVIRNREECNKALLGLKDGPYLVTVKAISRRSLSLNAYYWVAVLPAALRGFQDAGYDELTESEEIHEFFKRRFLTRSIVSKKTGEIMETILSTTMLNNEEFNNYLDQIGRFCAEYLSTYIPALGEPIAVLKEYAKQFQ